MTALSDQRLVVAYQRDTGEPGDLKPYALRAEIKRRWLDV